MKKIVFLAGFGILLLAGVAGRAQAQSADTYRPTVPQGVTATAVPTNQINVSWSASTDNVGVAGYDLYRDGTFITQINTTSFSDSGLSPGLHTYTVVAFDAAGNTSFPSFPAGAIVISDTAAPTVPVSVTASAHPTSTRTTATITVSWGASTDNVGVAGYRVYRDRALLNTTTTVTGTSYADPNMPPGTYSYTVSAYDAVGNTSGNSAPGSITIVLDVVPPSTPPQPTVTARGASTVNLSWKASTDEVGVVGYYLLRDQSPLATMATTTYVDSPPAGTHSYNVAAYDAAGNQSPWSSPAYATTMVDTASPTPPRGITISPLSASSMRISWSPSYDDVGVTGYSVYRNGASLGTTASTTWDDLNIASGTFEYSITAHDAAGNVSVMPIAASVIVPFPMNPPPQAGAAWTGTTSAPPPPPASSPVKGTVFTTSLFYGLRGAQVKTIQTFLVSRGYLPAGNATGFFGALTQAAVKKFQCDWEIVCQGAPGTTGWGLVGAKTRAILNKLSP